MYALAEKDHDTVVFFPSAEFNGSPAAQIVVLLYWSPKAYSFHLLFSEVRPQGPQGRLRSSNPGTGRGSRVLLRDTSAVQMDHYFLQPCLTTVMLIDS